MEVIELDFITIIVAAIIYMVIGALWYSKSMFGEIWMKIHSAKKKKPKLLLIAGFVNAIVISFFLSLLIAYLGATSTMDGIYAALGVWLGFVVTTQFPMYLWSDRSWKAFFIDIGYQGIGLTAMGALIGA